MIKRKILVVDDTPEARASIERVLVKAGYEVALSGSGREALYILKQRKIDCILLDHLMPEMSGLEVIRIIKSDPELKIIPVIMLTAVDTEDAIIAGLNAGADDYVVKISNPSIIVARVEAMLRLGRLQRELYEKSILCEHANTDLRKLDALKSEFIAVVSHELRTPLSITKEGLNLILDEVTGKLNQQQKELLEVAKNNIERLGRIIGDILDISKIEAGKLPLHKSIVDASQILHDLFVFHKDTAEQKGVKFNLEAPLHRIPIYLDRERIIQVLVNLISNAIKFTKEGGSIKVKLTEDERELVFSVEDTGIGIAESDMGKIFDKFQQFSDAQGMGQKGTGLGLSIAKKIVEIHKGRIWFYSKLGEGSEFSFSLPKYSQEDMLKEHIKEGIEDAKGKLSKFTVIDIEISPGVNSEFLEGLQACVNGIMRRPIDSTLVYKDHLLIFLGDTSKENAQAVKRRVMEACSHFSYSGIDPKKKNNFNAMVINYPDDVLSEKDFINKIV
ncbi:MAG: hybrid sensor histidine kinase/response regulator [Candidatus Omnitrophota bacterium]|nr:hybrid sensor histidine kinase/response regulator [Candidatus Omnitrophota bacterium]